VIFRACQSRLQENKRLLGAFERDLYLCPGDMAKVSHITMIRPNPQCERPCRISYPYDYECEWDRFKDEYELSAYHFTPYNGQLPPDWERYDLLATISQSTPPYRKAANLSWLGGSNGSAARLIGYGQMTSHRLATNTVQLKSLATPTMMPIT
jgi:hypothetical protein